MNPSAIAYFRHLLAFDMKMARNFYNDCNSVVTQSYLISIDSDQDFQVNEENDEDETSDYDQISACVEKMVAMGSNLGRAEEMEAFKATIKEWLATDEITTIFKKAEEYNYRESRNFHHGNWEFDLWFHPKGKGTTVHNLYFPLDKARVDEMKKLLEEADAPVGTV